MTNKYSFNWWRENAAALKTDVEAALGVGMAQWGLDSPMEGSTATAGRTAAGTEEQVVAVCLITCLCCQGIWRGPHVAAK